MINYILITQFIFLIVLSVKYIIFREYMKKFMNTTNNSLKSYSDTLRTTISAVSALNSKTELYQADNMKTQSNLLEILKVQQGHLEFILDSLKKDVLVNNVGTKSYN